MAQRAPGPAKRHPDPRYVRVCLARLDPDAFSAWAAQQNLVLGQVAVDEKSNEITALPRLLHCSTSLAASSSSTPSSPRRTSRRKATTLALKQNHPTLYEDVALYLDWARQLKYSDPNGTAIPTVFKGTFGIGKRGPDGVGTDGPVTGGSPR